MTENTQIPAQEEEVKPVFVDSVKITQFEDQVVVERMDAQGEVTGNDPIADVEMLELLEKTVTLIKEKMDYLRTRNASYEGHMLAIQELQRQQTEALAAQAAQVQMPE